MLKKLMLSLVVSSACFLVSQATEAMNNNEGDVAPKGPVKKPPSWVPQSPHKHGVPEHWKEKARDHPEFVRITHEGTLLFSWTFANNPDLFELYYSSSDDE